MKIALLILLVAIVLTVIFIKAGSNELPYSRVGALFTPAEQAFLKILTVAVGHDYLIFGKVRVADLVQPTIKRGSKGYLPALNRVAQKHVDYVLCHPQTLIPICVVELNDKSHQASDRKGRDLFLTRVFAKVKLPCLWIAWQRDYDPVSIRLQLDAAINPPRPPVKA